MQIVVCTEFEPAEEDLRSLWVRSKSILPVKGIMWYLSLHLCQCSRTDIHEWPRFDRQRCWLVSWGCCEVPIDRQLAIKNHSLGSPIGKVHRGQWNRNCRSWPPFLYSTTSLAHGLWWRSAKNPNRSSKIGSPAFAFSLKTLALPSSLSCDLTMIAPSVFRRGRVAKLLSITSWSSIRIREHQAIWRWLWKRTMNSPQIQSDGIDNQKARCRNQISGWKTVFIRTDSRPWGQQWRMQLVALLRVSEHQHWMSRRQISGLEITTHRL
jgi:hypothetical protein